MYPEIEGNIKYCEYYFENCFKLTDEEETNADEWFWFKKELI